MGVTAGEIRETSRFPSIGEDEAASAALGLAAKPLREGFLPEALHCYRDGRGFPLFWRIRLKQPGTGAKWIRPMVFKGSEFQLGEPDAPPEGKPLYLQHALGDPESGEPVFVVEGEWCADWLSDLGLAVTTAGSASNVATADWSPLTGRAVVIWPDADIAGEKAAEEAALRLSEIGCQVEIIDVDQIGVPEKGDAVDWLRANAFASRDDVLALPRLPYVAPDREGVKLVRMSDLEMRPIEWLWDGWLARGKMHILAGSPGTGKTTISLALAATVSTGGRWPDGTVCAGGRPANVIIWSGEDDPTDTIAPRLAAAGADLRMVHAIDSVCVDGTRALFDPSRHIPELAARMAELGEVGLLIVDPIVSAVAGDSHKNSEVRRALEPLVRLSQDFGCALLGISHFSKGTGGKDPTERVTGSIAFGALARVVLGTVKPKEEGEPRLLVRTKANIGPDSGGFTYALDQVEIAPGLSASRVVWGSAVEGSARDLIGDAEGDDAERTATDEAVDLLKEELAGGPRAASEIQKSARAAGISDKALRTARTRLGIKPEKAGFGSGASWVWAIPHEDALGARRCPNSEAGHLRDARASSGEQGFEL